MYPYRLMFILTVFASICKGQQEKKCNVFPKDLYIEVGSDTKLECHTSCAHGKVFWKLNDTVIDESQLTTANSSVTVLSLKNFTAQRATLKCCSADGVILGGTIIKTYSKPSKVSCFLYNAIQNSIGVPDFLRCNWEHQRNPSKDTRYTILSSSSSDLSQSEICTSYNTSCTHEYGGRIVTKINFNSKNISFTVRAKSADFEAYSETQEVLRLYHMWKMIRPKIGVSTHSDHLLVNWNYTHFSSGVVKCQVRYNKVNTAKSPEQVKIKTLSPKEKGELTFGNLESCSTYIFTVRCAFEKAPWSDWSFEKRALTQLHMTKVKLQLWRKISDSLKNGSRKVQVMWTGIPSTCKDALTYSIKLTPLKQHTKRANTKTIPCGNSPCDVEVGKDAHRITLTVLRNDTSVEDSVYVPAVGESLPEVTDIQASTLEGVILVSWKAPVQPVSGYVIDYTHDGNQYHWKESKYTNITLTDLQDKTRYNITVTPLLNGTTGHSTRALPICSSVGAPANITITDVQGDDKRAVVSWDVRSEVDCRGAIVGYTVFYSTQNGPELNVSLDGSKQFVYLKDLTPDTQYHVYIKASALTGTTQSSEWLFTTRKFDPKLLTAFLVCGGLTMVLLLFLCVCCASRWKKISEKPIPNPGLSSVALWSSSGSQEGMLAIQPFSCPTESCCDRVYPEELEGTQVSVQPKDREGKPARLDAEERTVPDVVPEPNLPGKEPSESTEMMHLSSSEESTPMLHSESDQYSPYRSQSSVGVTAQKTNKQNKRVAVKQQEKTVTPTVYVTWDMFQTGKGQLKELDTK
ncbi:interleukin-6 receptor subunit beta-like [Halichoeres trimaculatus]|uniref:interleukin-6 receptor subunit beta-like n=1 Tax=Halichoeres trimaculatus TaxID=147232 RepID=UPI003D9F0AE7